MVNPATQTQPGATNGALAPTPVPGGMPAPVLPRDALGVSLLVVCAAMALDILAPWSESFSVRQSLVSRFGHPAFVVVAMALAAALPLYRPQWRRTALCAAAPLVIGALSVGIGLTYYIFLARENAQALNAAAGGYPPLTAQQTSATPISPQLGLYLFILIGVVLVVVGYQLFLAAARSQVVILAPVQPHPFVVAPPPVQIIAPALIPSAAIPVSAMHGAPSPASVPVTPAPIAAVPVVLPVSGAPIPSAPSQPVTPLKPVGTPLAPAAPSIPLTPVAAQPAPVPTSAQPSQNGASVQKGPVLPGTDAWNEAPVSPAVNRQSRLRGGWRYSSR